MLLKWTNMDQKSLETVFSITICHHSVSNDFWSIFADSVNIFDGRLPGLVSVS